ncbi:MAG: preprotein translocase subunit SecG [Bacteroidota bacterium]
MFTLLITFILIVAVLLILVVLIQNSKKEGLGNPLGDTSAGQLIGVKKTSDLLEQVTWGLIIALFGLSLATTSFLEKTGATGNLPASPNIERAQERNELPEAGQEETPPPAQP